MVSRAYNKTTREWISTTTPETLAEPWIIEPIFENEELAMLMGQTFWLFDGNIIRTPTLQEYNATIKTQMQTKKWIEIQVERERRRAGGVKVGNNWFHSDDSSRIQQLGLLLMGTSMPAGIMWKTMSGSFVEMTPTLVSQIFQASAAHEMTVFAAAEQHRAQMLLANNPCDYTFSSGWPLIFGE